MKNLKYVLVLLLFGCSTSKVVYDYDIRTDFSKYKTYDYFEDVGEGLNELDVKRFSRSMETYLNSLGINRNEKPNFYINIISEKSEIVGDGIGIGIGTGGRNVGVGVSTGITLGGKKLNERITIDFVDAENNKLFWQGVLDIKVREKIKPEDRVILVNNIISRILSRYPPKK